MKKTFYWLFILLLLPVAAFGQQVRSIYPETAIIGSPVTIIGGPFTDQVLVSLGGQEILPVSVSSRQLVFVVPPLPVGEHALFLSVDGQVSAETYALLVEFPPPAIESISPAHIDVCANEDQRQLQLQATNVQAGARLLLDKNVIPFIQEGGAAYSFTAPQLRAGSYGLQLINPDGKTSLPQTLWVSNVPAIESISVGDDFVNYYQVIISGKNFFHNSALLITEYARDFAAQPPQQRFIPAQGGSAVTGAARQTLQRESFRFQDCNTLIYDRHPVSGQSRRIVLRVGNPDGKQTDPFEIFLP